MKFFLPIIEPSSLIELALWYKVEPYELLDFAMLYHKFIFGQVDDIWLNDETEYLFIIKIINK